MTENHHGQPKDDEATMTERVRQAQEADWETDPDWQVFQRLYYSDTETPGAPAQRPRSP